MPCHCELLTRLADLLEGFYGRYIDDAYDRGDATRDERDAVQDARLVVSRCCRTAAGSRAGL